MTKITTNTPCNYIYYKYRQEEIDGHLVSSVDRNGFLYDQHFNLTEFKSTDLPKSYIYGTYEDGVGYLDSYAVKGVSLIHADSSTFLDKDILLVSYQTEKPTTQDNDCFVRGNDILSFLRGVYDNSEFDIYPLYLQIKEYFDTFNLKHRNAPYAAFNLHIALFGFPSGYRSIKRYNGDERLMRYEYETEQMRLQEIAEHQRQLAEWRKRY